MSSRQRGHTTGSRIDRIIEAIASQMENGSEWSLNIETLGSLLDVRLEEMYRSLYTSTALVSGYIPEKFERENISDLIALVGAVTGEPCESIFADVGLFLRHDDLRDLAVVYYDTLADAVDAHQPDGDTYRQMLDRFKSHGRAFPVYLDYFFNLDDLFNTVVEAFTHSKGYASPSVGRTTVQAVLQSLLDRNIIAPEGIFQKVFDSLTGRFTADEGSEASYSQDPALQSALSAFGLPRMPLNAQELRNHYKVLMKTYHPDINPDGLEKSKKINTAYSVLLARLL